ncbi:HEPN domain-containing protein [Fulvivirga lutimaris]|uniref:HEPN domain-containing protein n=1 Tax=Fulvivirga lutimaris TaxID=1819566 RepID=UPI0012BCDCD9|nr:HEPN domain-containing protein [Fulvivirga lutimaris]MTI41252.1 hypothetical protein [Fulvivirga lutimaris]
MAVFSAVEDFKEAVEEINLLLNYAKRNTRNMKRYSTFNKTAIILLCTKFESFLENFLEEYCYEHLKCSTNKNLNTHLYEHILIALIDELNTHKTRPEKRNELIEKVVSLCGVAELSEIETFKIKPKFSYGKHGQSEIEKLLKQFGFRDFLVKEDTLGFFRNFNSLNFVRNNIIHEDATPSLTHQDVQKYLSEINDFIDDLTTDAKLELDKI